ncbi:MAG TPA: hypothetical protein VJ908_00265 [Wenzhouxiangellaceae bacterium]|nr:hypothetical protein [Wenzhouxiangellaceae bacterium]
MSEILSSPLFLVGTVVLILLALLFTLLPILRGGSAGSRLARRRRALEELREDLDPSDYRKRLAKLELEQADASGSAISPRGLAGLLVVSVPLLTLFFYSQVGRPDGIDPEPGPNGELRQILGELTSRVRNEPEDIDAWNQLGMIWKQLQQYPASEGAFRRVIYIEPDNEFARVELAETLLYASSRAQLPAESQALLDSVLADNRDNQKALWLAGLGAFHDGDQQRALVLWTRLRDQLPEGSVRQRVSEQIAEITGAPAPEPAEQPAATAMVNPHAAMPPPRNAPAPSPAGNPAADEQQDGASIQVEVTVDPSLAGRLNGSETVFVFARAVNGPPAPLAVKRLSASDLPMTVVLSDSDSMAQGLSLSTFPQVQISARISRTGNAIASTGDLQGQSGPVTVNETDRLGIMIDEVIE